MRWTSVLVFAALATAAQAADPYAFKLEITPMEGPLVPAVEARYTPALKICQDKAVTTQQNADCFAAEFTRQDAILNKTWKATLARLPEDRRAPLLAAQRKWIAGRDPFCKKNATSEGTIGPLEYVSCRAELTIRRSLWLENLK